MPLSSTSPITAERAFDLYQATSSNQHISTPEQAARRFVNDWLVNLSPHATSDDFKSFLKEFEKNIRLHPNTRPGFDPDRQIIALRRALKNKFPTSNIEVPAETIAPTTTISSPTPPTNSYNLGTPIQREAKSTKPKVSSPLTKGPWYAEPATTSATHTAPTPRPDKPTVDKVKKATVQDVQDAYAELIEELTALSASHPASTMQPAPHTDEHKPVKKENIIPVSSISTTASSEEDATVIVPVNTSKVSPSFSTSKSGNILSKLGPSSRRLLEMIGHAGSLLASPFFPSVNASNFEIKSPPPSPTKISKNSNKLTK